MYAVEDYLATLRREGGQIEEMMNPSAIYEFCFFKADECRVNSIFRIFGTNFSNKLWLLEPSDQGLASLACKIG